MLYFWLDFEFCVMSQRKLSLVGYFQSVATAQL